MPLEAYRRKRDFARTPEPEPGRVGEGAGRFVVHRHRATRLHYDLRLEMDGILASWAVPRGPTLDPDTRRLARHTEDHPIEYLTFEGVIPGGQYGAGDMIVWDWGTYEPEETDDPGAAVRGGELKLRLHGEKLHGRFTLVQTGRRPRSGRDAADPDAWLLLHKRDEHAVAGWDPEDHPASVRSGRTNEEVAAGVRAKLDAAPPEAVEAPDLGRAVVAAMPDFIPPMLATAVDDAFDAADWLFEVKWDGYRVEAVVRDGRARLWTRNHNDAAGYFPDLAGPAAWIAGHDAIVDGEVVALDQEGRPSFSLLQERTGLRGLGSGRGRASPARSRTERSAIPIAYCVFDLLYLDGRSLLEVPLEQRKATLERVLRPDPLVRYASHIVGDGRAFLEAAREQGLEGVVAKRRDGSYEPGHRSQTWLKVKLRLEQEVVVAGWLEGQGSHRDLGSLVVALNEAGRLRHAGQVGSGLDAATRRRLLAELRTDERPNPALDPAPQLPQVHWVEPRIVVRAEFAEWTAEGLLRQPSFAGVQLDRDPSEVVREERRAVRRVLSSGRRPPPRDRSRPSGRRRSAAGRQAEAGDGGLTAASDELAALESIQDGERWTVGGREVRLTNLEKVIVEALPGGVDGPVTKRDLLRHYVSLGPLIIPYLRDRGTTVRRFPNGTAATGFWQKDLPGHAPEWVSRWTFRHRREGSKDYAVVDHVATLAWLAQEAAVELHPWTSTTAHADEPSYALVDIDPGTATSWDEVLVLGRLFRTALDHLGLTAAPKVTGQRGLQVWIPIRLGYSFEETRDWVEQLSRMVAATVPELVSWEWSKAERRGRARLDFTQNAINRTLVAPYSLRPSPGAPVSAPIAWDELDDPELRPDRWTVRTIAERVRAVGDRFRVALDRDQELPKL